MKRQALINFSEHQRDDAMRKYKIIEPYLTHQEGIKEISLKSAIPQRTLYRWVKSFEREGLIGLVRKTRSDFEQIKVSPKIREMTEDLVLRYKKISTKTLYRKIVVDCKENKTRIPSYSQIYKLRKSIPNSLIQLAHEGDKKYKETYDLITIREASRPNEIWQADHTLLDIHLIDENGKINRPWLTVILDDYSRAVAGYYLSFSAPSAMNTALTLHQAIWTKKDASWGIYGIPEKFYTDHGSDFTSNFIEQVAVDLKMNLIFSTIGVPRGRGKIERFFQTINQMLLESLPGYTKNKNEERLLKLQDFKEKIHSDGIHFQGLRYTNINLSTFVGESVLIRYTPNDLAEIRVFYKNKFLCSAISPEISDYEINMDDLVSARNKRKRLLKQKVNAPSSLELLVEDKQSEKIVPPVKKSSLKRYYNE